MSKVNLDSQSIVDEFLGAGTAHVEEPVVEEEPCEEFVAEKTKKVNGKKYSDVFGWDKSLDGRADFSLEVFKKSDWDKADQDKIPQVDANREVDHSVMYPLVLSMQPKMKGMKPLLVGPTGSGKTTAVEYFCAQTNRPMYRINGRGDMESDTLIGRPWVGESGMEYILGELPKALLAGHVILIDEPWKIPSSIWMTLQRLMERGGVLQIDDMPDDLDAKTIVPHERARVILADNVVGTGDNVQQYGATMIQDGSTLNRIDLIIDVPYLSEEKEIELMARKFPRLVPTKGEVRNLKNVTSMVRLLNLLRQGYDTQVLSSPVSFRTLESWAELAIEIEDYKESFKWSVLNRYAEESERGAVAQHFYTVYGKQL